MAKKTKSAFSRQLQRAGHYLVYAVFRIFEAVLRALSVEMVARLGRCGGLIGWLLAGKYRRLAQNNLRIAFGTEMDEAAIKALTREHFALLGSNILCGLKLPTMGEQAVLERVQVEGMEHAARIANGGRPVLYAVSHLSCWELLTQVPSVVSFGRRASSIYQPLGNPYLDAHVRANREKLGYVLFDRSAGFAEPMKHLREHGGVLGVLVDQHAGDKGVWCPFFDRLASTTPLPALMALRCDTPLVPISVHTEGLARWRIIMHPPVGDGEKNAEAATAELNLTLERIIRRTPADWFWVHNRWKTPKPEFLLSHYRRGLVLPAGYDVKRLKPFHLILRSPNWLGDACMAFPAVRALRQGRPDLKLTVFTPGKLADLWRSLGIVDEIITKDGKEGLFAVAKRIREAGPYDAGILFTNSTRSTLEFWLAGIPRLVGYRGSLRSRLLNQITPEPKPGLPPEHQVYRYLRLARYCGAVTDSPKLFETGLPAGSHDGVLRIGLCAGAEYGPAKRWPLERYAAVANALPQVEWVLFGAPGEKAMGEQLASMITGRHLNLVGRTTLDDLIHSLRECALLLTNDTGTMHLAAAVGVPTVAIFGSTEPVLTGPPGPGHTIIRHHVPCSPCFKRECPFVHYDCMTGVTPEMVVAALRQRLGV